MPLDATDIILRSDKGSPLTIEEVDGNFDALRDFANALEASLSVVLNPDGTLKAGSVDTEALQAQVVKPEHLHDDVPGDGLEFDGARRLKVTDALLEFGGDISAEEAAREAADGDLGTLSTTEQGSLVGAINEVFGMFSGYADLDALHTAIQQLVMPVGAMVDWSGAISAIPAGWGLCDGTDYGSVVAPDLTDHFIVHADADGGGTNDVGDEVGLNTAPGHTHSMPANTGGHALVEDEVPEHTHNENLYGTSGGGVSGNFAEGGSTLQSSGETDAFGKAPADAHTHPIGGSSGSGGGHDNRPLAYAYAKIIFHGVVP